MKNFANLISDNKMDPSTQNVLSQLCKLYAVHGIVENMGEFMQDGYFNPGQVIILNRKVLTLLEDIRPNAVALVDDLVQSIHSSYYNYIKPMMDRRSKGLEATAKL